AAPEPDRGAFCRGFGRSVRRLKDKTRHATSEIGIETGTQSMAPPRNAAEPGDQSFRAWAHHDHADSREGRAAGSGKDDHAREARHAAITAASSVINHDPCRDQKTLQRHRA